MSAGLRRNKTALALASAHTRRNAHTSVQLRRHGGDKCSCARGRAVLFHLAKIEYRRRRGGESGKKHG
ncbi:hypothetical protein C8R44DRAFT_810471, partial [Mycena epipterygia]